QSSKRRCCRRCQRRPRRTPSRTTHPGKATPPNSTSAAFSSLAPLGHRKKLDLYGERAVPAVHFEQAVELLLVLANQLLGLRDLSVIHGEHGGGELALERPDLPQGALGVIEHGLVVALDRLARDVVLGIELARRKLEPPLAISLEEVNLDQQID